MGFPRRQTAVQRKPKPAQLPTQRAGGTAFPSSRSGPVTWEDSASGSSSRCRQEARVFMLPHSSPASALVHTQEPNTSPKQALDRSTPSLLLMDAGPSEGLLAASFLLRLICFPLWGALYFTVSAKRKSSQRCPSGQLSPWAECD